MGRHMLNPLKNLDKVRGVFKAAAAADGFHRIAVAQHQTGMGDPDAVEIVHIRGAGVGFKPAAKVGFTVSGHLGHFLNGHFPAVIFVGPADDLLQAGGPEAGVGGGGILTAVHMVGELPEQLRDGGKTCHQVSVPFDQALDDGLDCRIGRTEILHLTQRQIFQGQIILHMEIAVHLLETDFEHIHGAAPGLYDVGMEGIGRNDEKLLSFQCKTLIFNHNFTTQIFA